MWPSLPPQQGWQLQEVSSACSFSWIGVSIWNYGWRGCLPLDTTAVSPVEAIEPPLLFLWTPFATLLKKKLCLCLKVWQSLYLFTRLKNDKSYDFFCFVLGLCSFFYKENNFTRKKKKSLTSSKPISWLNKWTYWTYSSFLPYQGLCCTCMWGGSLSCFVPELCGSISLFLRVAKLSWPKFGKARHSIHNV